MGDVNLVRGLGWVAGNGDGALSRLACGGLGSCGCSRQENKHNGKGRGLEQGGITSEVGTLADPAALVVSLGAPGTKPRTATWPHVQPAWMLATRRPSTLAPRPAGLDARHEARVDGWPRPARLDALGGP
jgi:hypothetical protein